MHAGARTIMSPRVWLINSPFHPLSNVYKMVYSLSLTNSSPNDLINSIPPIDSEVEGDAGISDGGNNSDTQPPMYGSTNLSDVHVLGRRFVAAHRTIDLINISSIYLNNANDASEGNEDGRPLSSLDHRLLH